MNKEFKDFMRDVPRGDSNRYLSQQSAPQARWMKLEEIAESHLLSYDPHNPGKKILKRQLILWAGKHPMMIERVEHFNKSGALAKYL